MKAECKHSQDPQMVTKSLQGRKIYKDQCVRCFHQPTKPDGLFVCMKCFNGFCPNDREQHALDHQHYLYYHFKKTLVQSEQKTQITKLAIGVQGGASAGPTYTSQYHIYCSQCQTFDFQGVQQFQAQLKSFINTQALYKQQLAVAWEDKQQPCQHTLTIQQAPINKDFSKCMKCDISTNLWLCLTCGSTGCARKNWDGSGGNNHGVEHYNETKHPLVVKLGTINAEGNASVNCYTCDQGVKDNFLQDHLKVLGINMKDQSKTEKTMAQLNIQYNLNVSLSRLIEGDKQQSIPMYGPGYTGMENIGNSCYLNSVVQALNSLDQFKDQYYNKGIQHIKTCKRIPANCFYCQVSKISWGLYSGKYSEKLTKTRIINDIEQSQEYQQAIKPYHFKLLMADKNQDFCGGEQQDALEYLQWVFDRLNQQEPKFNGAVIPKLFDYHSTNVLICTKCNGQKHVNEKTNELKFPLPKPTQADLDQYYESLQKQTNKEIKDSKLAQDPIYHVQFDICRQMLLSGDSREAMCPKCQINTEFQSHNYFKTTPKYLLMIPNRFYIQGNAFKKLNAIINMPQQLDVSKFLLKNAQHEGEMMKQEKKKKYDQAGVEMIMQMGQTKNAAIRALMANNNNVEVALNWIFENMDLPNLNDPIPDDDDEAGDVKINQQDIEQVKQMGFQDKQAKIALIKNNSNIAAAIQWLFNCGGDVSAFNDLLKPKEKVQSDPNAEVNEKYKLKAVIIHLGRTVHHGHYVVYVKKQGKWVLFNDDKVTIQNDAVLGKGYIYLYEAI